MAVDDAWLPASVQPTEALRQESSRDPDTGIGPVAGILLGVAAGALLWLLAFIAF